MARAAVTLFYVLALVLVAAEAAHACTCAMDTPEERFHGSGAVFAGRVAEVKRDLVNFGDDVITFDVEASWKHVGKKRVTVRNADMHHGSCHINYQVGEQYLVYAFISENGTLETTMCSGTTGLGAAAEDLAFLRKRVALTLTGPEPRAGRRSYAEVFSATNIAATLLLSAGLFLIAGRWRAA